MAADRAEFPLVEVDDPKRLVAHPLANFVTMMSDDEFLELRKSIRFRGLLPQEEIILHEGKVLDGRNRLKACLAEGVEPRFRQYVGTDPRGFVLAKITRRDLDESRKAMIVAALIADQEREGDKKNQYTHQQLSQMFGVGQTIILEANRVLKNGTPELQKLVVNGHVPVKAAEKVARLPVKEQREVVKAGAESVKIKAAQIKKAKDLLPVAPVDPDRPPVVVRGFDAATADLLQQIKRLAASLTRHIKSKEGKKFEEYVRLAHPQTAGWIDYGRVKLTDKGEGLEAVNAAFTGLQPLYRMLVAASRDRQYPASELLKLLGFQGDNPLDGDRPPDEPAEEKPQLVEPESL